MGLAVCGAAARKGTGNVRFPGTSPASEGTHEPEILALQPAVYLKFGSDLADSSGSSRNGALVGSGGSFVAALAPNVGSGNLAFDTEGTAAVSVAHATTDTALTFPTDWEALYNASPSSSSLERLDPYRFIAEATISIWFKPNALPTGSNRAVIFAKSNTESPLAAGGPSSASYVETHPISATTGSVVPGGSFEAYFDANGAVHVEMRSFRGRPCRIRTVAGAVSVGTGYHLVVTLGYDGVAAWLNGAKFEDGYANLLHVFGLAANIRGINFRNNYAWTIGKAAWGGQADITVDEFAVFLRRPSTTLSQSNVNTLAQVGSTPASLAHYIWGALTVNASSYGNIQAAVDDVTASGGGTVLINPGTYGQNVTMKSNVRLKANGGTVNINGWCRTPAVSPTGLGVGSGAFGIGARTISVTNSASAGRVLRVKGTVAALLHERRWSTGSEGNDVNSADGQVFEIESATGSAITVVGVGSTYDIPQASREYIQVVNVARWVALEGDIRFVSTDTIKLDSLAYGRLVGVSARNTSTTNNHAIFIGQSSLFVQGRNVTCTNGTLGAGTSENDGITHWLGASECVWKDCDAFEGRHAADVAGGGTHPPAVNNEFHNITWTNNNSRSAPGSRAAFGVHGPSSLGIYWNIDCNWGGPCVTGFKHDARWSVCGLSSVASSGCLQINDGGEGLWLRDIHVLRPSDWFARTEDAVGVERCRFENITRSATPPGTSHNVRYGTGSEVNTYSNVDGPPNPNPWQEV